MVLGATGVRTTPEALAGQVFLPGKGGSLQVELMAAARRHGQLAYVLAPRLDDLLAELAAEHPVIVLQNLGLARYPIWHYAVAVGFDRQRGELLLRSGPHPRQPVPLRRFERSWQDGGRWALLVLPAGELPATAERARYLGAAMDLEQTGQREAALDSYQAALSRWPDDLTALIGAGNSAHALGRFDLAAHHFGRASERHPNSGEAFNNLADTLLRLGQHQPALEAARRAVQLGGPLQEQFAATLGEIEAAVGGTSPVTRGPTAAP
jgi:tetratricopeptide (TPR) repeat protein